MAEKRVVDTMRCCQLGPGFFKNNWYQASVFIIDRLVWHGVVSTSLATHWRWEEAPCSAVFLCLKVNFAVVSLGK